MHQGVRAEDVADRLAQRLAAVDDEQDRLPGIEAAVDEIGQQRRASVAFSVLPSQSPSGILTPSVLIPKATTCVRSAISRPSSIITARRTSSSRRDINSPARCACARRRPLRPSTCPSPSSCGLDVGADRLADARVLAGRDAGEHPVHHRPRERVTIGEVLIAATVSSRSPSAVRTRGADRHAPAAQRHRPLLVAVTDRHPVGVMLALRAHDLGDLELHQLVHNAEPDPHAERQQPLPRGPDQLAERFLDLAGSGLSLASTAVTTFGADTLPMAVPPVLADLVGACHARIASGRGGRTAAQSSTRSRTTSRGQPWGDPWYLRRPRIRGRR